MKAGPVMPQLVAFTFADFTVDLVNRCLLKRVSGTTKRCKLRPQCFELLAYLLANRNQTLSNEQIWHNIPSNGPGNHDFDPDKLNRAVFDLKAVLGNSIIIEKPRQGYRRLKCDHVEEIRTAQDSVKPPLRLIWRIPSIRLGK